jgi:hypothetical protein
VAGAIDLSDESLFREVDEDVRQEHYKKLWDRFGNAVLAAAFLVVAGVAGFKGYQYWQVKQAEAAADSYLAAIKLAADGKKDDAAAGFAAIGHGGFQQLAQFERAGLLAEAGKTDEAAAAFESLAANASAHQTLRDAAAIRAGYLLSDRATPDQLLPKLGGYDKDGNPWRLAAREIFAIAAYRTGDFAMADRYFNAIFADPAATTAMRQRSQAMIQLITPKLATK